MQTQTSHLSHGQFFAYSDIKLCQIICSSPIIPQLTHCFIAYKDDSTTIDTLLQYLKRQQKDKLKSLSTNQTLKLSIGNYLLKKQMTIRELRSILHNYSTKILVFDLVINVSSSLGLECSVVSEVLEKHPLYKQISANENKIQICIELPQLNKVYYYPMNATKTLKAEIDQFLRLKKDQKKWQFNVQSYSVKCKKCKKVIQQPKLKQPTFKHFQQHFTISITFSNIIVYQHFNKRSEDVEILIKRSSIDDVPLYRVRYGEVRKKKVKSVLQNCENLMKFYNFGLRIGDKILKPFQCISAVNDLAAMKGGKIDAFLVDESQIFYDLSHHFQKDSFDLDQIIKESKAIRKKEIQQKISVSRSRIISSEKNKTFRNNEFFDPILGYTSPLYYQVLNSYLRDTDLGWLREDQLENIYFKCAFALIKSLHCLPNYNGITYRGTKELFGQFMKQGKYICFKSFTSTSTIRKKAEGFGKNTFFIIHCLTGKSISKYSLYAEDEVLIMPHAYFYVLSVTSDNDECYLVELQQIPIPRRKNHNILLWVDDNPQQGFNTYKNLYGLYPMMRTEFIHLLSNYSLQEWMLKFSYLIGYANKISVITDMKRGEKSEEGIKTIEIIRKYIPIASIMVYVNRKMETVELMKSRGLEQSQALMVGNQKEEVFRFIQEKVFSPEEMESNQCSIM